MAIRRQPGDLYDDTMGDIYTPDVIQPYESGGYTAPPPTGGVEQPNPGPSGPYDPAPAPQTSGYNREQTRDFFMSNTPNSAGDIDQWIKDNPFMEGVKRLTNDVVEMPNGERYDIWGGMGSSNDRGTWTPVPGAGEWASMPGQQGPAPAPSGAPSWLSAPTGGSMGGSFGSATGSASSGRGFGDIQAQLAKLYPDGMFNEDIVNRRTEMAREAGERARQSRMKTAGAALASRGQGVDDGTYASSVENIETDTFDQLMGEVSGIYANESENADERMIQALQIAAGLTEAEARIAVEQFRAQSDDALGWGGLALGNKKADQDYSIGNRQVDLGYFNGGNSFALGQGQLGLGRDSLAFDMEQGQFGNYMDILKLLVPGAGISADGFI
jgi:hypothetical protein